LRHVQTAFNVVDYCAMTKSTRLIWFCAWFKNHVLVCGLLVASGTVSVVTGDAPQFTMHRFGELGIAEKNFFPRFQRGNGAASALAFGCF
jgi:hypothetical protein